MEPLTILFRDACLLAVDKPPGLLVHRSAVAARARDFALQRARALAGGRVYPVHRLDRPTSGVLLFALSPGLAREMGRQFSENAVVKTYLAVVRGHAPAEGVIDYPLVEEHDPASDGRARSPKAARSAVTAYRRLATVELPLAVGRYPTARYSLLAAVPRSGRRHQIRRHLKHVYHPVIGDTTHGDGKHNALFRELLRCRRLLLHAARLEFVHPLSGETMRIDAPPDPPFAAVLATLGWDNIEIPVEENFRCRPPE